MHNKSDKKPQPCANRSCKRRPAVFICGLCFDCSNKLEKKLKDRYEKY